MPPTSQYVRQDVPHSMFKQHFPSKQGKIPNVLYPKQKNPQRSKLYARAIPNLPCLTPLKRQMVGGERCVVLDLPVEDPTFDLEKAVCSHGLFMMAPNRWDHTTRTLERPLRLSSAATPTVRISHPSPSRPLVVTVLGTTSLSSHDQQAVLAQVRRMLRISDENDRAIKGFHKLHPASKERGFGRIFRSPTLFEDMVKCILLCNCQWPRTLSMARALCELQLELKCSSTGENFLPKMPQPRELKRKQGKGKKVVLKLETKFVENKAKMAEDAKSVVSHDNQPMGDSHGSSDSSLLSNVNVKDTSIPAPQLSSGMSHSSAQIGDFPTPEELASLDARFLAKRCNLGYRAQRVLSLAQSIVAGKLHIWKLKEVSDGFMSANYDELDKQLSGISGFGPFTRANVLMCMGFYHRIPADTETIRHLKHFHAKRSCTVRSVKKDVETTYEKYAPFQFLAYWSEMWDYYERRFGKLSEIPSSDYRLITASNMKHKTSKECNMP